MSSTLFESSSELKVAKSMSNARWSARADAVCALTNAYKQTMSALEEFSLDNSQLAEARAEANGILKCMKGLEAVILLEVCQTILEIIHITNLQQQKAGLPLNTAVKLMQSLLHFVEELRPKFDDFEVKGMAKCGRSDNAVYCEDT